MPKLYTIIVFVLSVLICSISVQAENIYKNRSLSERVDRLERLISSQKQLELLNRLQQLQQDNQQLRAFLEEQNNTIRQLRQQQKQHYADISRRLNQLAADKSLSIIEENKAPSDKDKASEAAHTSPLALEGKSEQEIYQSAYNELRSGYYSRAKDLFAVLIQYYPDGHYAHLGQYWMAEASFAQHNYKQAIIDYQRLLDNYPASSKKAEAELKKANSYYKLGNINSARYTLKQLLIHYPDTIEAGQAKRLLKKL